LAGARGDGVVAGVGEDGGDSLGGAGGDGGEEGDLVHVVFVEGLDVEGLIQRGLDALGVQGDGVGKQRDEVEQGGVVAGRRGAVEGL